MNLIVYFLTSLMVCTSVFSDINKKNKIDANSSIFKVGKDLFDAKASGNCFIIESHIQEDGNRKYVLITLSDDIDDSQIFFVNIVNRLDNENKIDFNKSFYISISCKEMKSIIKIKNMFLPPSSINMENNKDILTLFKKDVCLANFQNDIYQGKINGQDINVFFSDEAKRKISKTINYKGLIDFLMEMDIESLGITDLSFDIIKSLLQNIKNRGFMMGISILLGEKRETLFQVLKIDNIQIDSNIFTIPEGIKRRGVEELL